MSHAQINKTTVIYVLKFCAFYILYNFFTPFYYTIIDGKYLHLLGYPDFYNIASSVFPLALRWEANFWPVYFCLQYKIAALSFAYISRF